MLLSCCVFKGWPDLGDSVKETEEERKWKVRTANCRSKGTRISVRKKQ